MVGVEMICWKVSHKYKLIDHIERKDIGVYHRGKIYC